MTTEYLAELKEEVKSEERFHRQRAMSAARTHKLVGVPAAISSSVLSLIVSGLSFFGSADILAGALALLVGIVVALNAALNPGKKSARHWAKYYAYKALGRDIRLLESRWSSKEMSGDNYANEVDRLQLRFKTIQSELITPPEDFDG